MNAAATGRVSWAPIVRGLGPLEEPVGDEMLPFIWGLHKRHEYMELALTKGLGKWGRSLKKKKNKRDYTVAVCSMKAQVFKENIWLVYRQTHLTSIH